ncbi:uncharacterized protein LOC115997019 [Ipomoea triloba]|uniref:uncharacterized protein LOC115997019 n=1 Tax=Ipomoea triloba TaxID=35885 RepID=UPI00125DF424|nr:uncharacterized protein LOC115997019 [Ipomoea triloba]
MELVRVQLGFQNMFVVDASGHKGGLAMLWQDSMELVITGFLKNHVDSTVILDIGSPQWRFTGYYGYPERARRRESWQLLRTLSGQTVTDCGFQDFGFMGNQFTWEKSRGTPDMIEEKLDRILTTDSWLTLFEGAKACSLTCPYSDHLPLILMPVVIPMGICHRRFYFDNARIREDKCREIISNRWSWTIGQDVLDHIAVCGIDLGRWGKNYNKEYQRKIDVCKSRLEHLCMRRDDTGFVEYARTENELIFLFNQQHTYWKQRAKEHWNKDGDLNTKLLRPMSAEEVRRAVFQMHPDKSPRPDGLGSGFFKHFWDIVGNDVTMLCRNFLHTAKLPTNANDTFIVLIPKKPNPDSMKDLRPIVLCNVIYKIVSKSAFGLGRLISDNIMLAYEGHHYLKRKTQGREEVVALKIDMSKAYDRVEWQFLKGVMLRMGFHQRWIAIMMETLVSVNENLDYLNQGLRDLKESPND